MAPPEIVAPGWRHDDVLQPSEELAACDGQRNVMRLKGLLVEQAMEHEQLSQELCARQSERRQLLQLLHQKDEELAWQEESLSRQRGVLVATGHTARHFRAVCALRAWREQVRGRTAQRLLTRTKSRCAAASLRQACGQLSVGLRSAVGRQLSKAIQAMWLHSTLQGLKMTEVSGDVADQSTMSSLDSMLEGFVSGACEPSADSLGKLSKSREAAEALLATPRPTSGSLDDEVLFATPVRGLQDRYLKPGQEMSPCLKVPQHRYFSTPSEDSTCVPSSSSQSRAGTSATSNPFAAPRLCLVLEAVSLRRQFWAMSQWHDHDAGVRGMKNEHRVVKDASSISHGNVALPESQCLNLEETVDRERAVELAKLRAECEQMECRAASLAGIEAEQQAEFHAAQLQEGILEQGSARLEEQLSRYKLSEQGVLSREEQVVRDLRQQLEGLQATNAQLELQSQESRAYCSTSEELLANSERSCALLETKIARKVQWRLEAEQHIQEMVFCGEHLEKERAQLRQKLSASRQEHKGASERVVSLRCSLEEEEQLGEVLRARSSALEEGNTALNRSLQHERQRRSEDVAYHREELRLAQQEEAKASAALSVADSSKRSEHQAAEFARAKLIAVWSKEKEEWSLQSSRTTLELQRRVSSLSEELRTSRCAEKAEVEAAAQAHDKAAAASSASFQHEVAAMRKAVRAELAGETELCRQMASQLEHRLAQAQELQEGLAEFASALPDPAMAKPRFFSSGFATPQLRELDEYAELVERLKIEVSREREERQATAQSLETLRSSYRLLLQRVSSR